MGRTRKFTDEERIIRRKYVDHRGSAENRGIDFQLSFEQWWEIWQASGKWGQRGVRKGCYCMSRYGDVGPYSVSNVFIQLHSDNMAEYSQKPRGPSITRGIPKGPRTTPAWNKGLSYKRGPYKKKEQNV